MFPCFNENIDFYLKRAKALHNKICAKNQKIIENKEKIRINQVKNKESIKNFN